MLNLNTPPDREHVVVTDIRIPFWSMVWLLFKASVAAIPAAIMIFALFIALGLASVLLLGSFRSLAGSVLGVPAARSTPDAR